MFYYFSQNNSGGSFVFDPDKGISHHVIVEADDLKEAVYRAERIGLYFDGDGDCSCCGNRWYEPYRDEGTQTPQLYSDGDEIQPYAKFEKKSSWMSKWINGPEGFIHYKDGSFKPFWDGERGY